MKIFLTIVVCIALGIGIGFYFGFMRAEDARTEVKNYISGLNADMDKLNKLREESAKEAAPWEASSASTSLAALKSMDANDAVGVRSRLASMVAIYYRNHLHDGDTNLIARIATYAATDTVLSNALKLQ